MRFGHAHRAAALGALCLLGACAPSEEEEDAAFAGDRLIGGQLAKPNEFPATLHLENGCTAAKVGPRHLLTAAHCVASPSTGAFYFGPASPVSLAVSTSPSRRYSKHDVAAVYRTDEWTRACLDSYCGISAVAAKVDAPDIAVIVLADELVGVPSVAVDASPMNEGDEVTLLGYGCTRGVHVTGAGDARLRWARGKVVAGTRALHEGSPVDANDVGVFAGNYALTAGPGAPDGTAGLCPGDSGGPLYAKRGGALVVVGVNANYTLRPDATDATGMPVTNWHTRVDDGSRHAVGAWLRSVGVDVVGAARR